MGRWNAGEGGGRARPAETSGNIEGGRGVQTFARTCLLWIEEQAHLRDWGAVRRAGDGCFRGADAVLVHEGKRMITGRGAGSGWGVPGDKKSGRAGMMEGVRRRSFWCIAAMIGEVGGLDPGEPAQKEAQNWIDQEERRKRSGRRSGRRRKALLGSRWWRRGGEDRAKRGRERANSGGCWGDVLREANAMRRATHCMARGGI